MVQFINDFYEKVPNRQTYTVPEQLRVHHSDSRPKLDSNILGDSTALYTISQVAKNCKWLPGILVRNTNCTTQSYSWFSSRGRKVRGGSMMGRWADMHMSWTSVQATSAEGRHGLWNRSCVVRMTEVKLPEWCISQFISHLKFWQRKLCTQLLKHAQLVSPNSVFDQHCFAIPLHCTMP